MGHQQSNQLNCKANITNQRHEQVTATKQFFGRKKKPTSPTEQSSDISTSNFPTQNAITAPKSPRTELTRATSQKNISSKSSRQATKQKTFIPQHEAITKVSETVFRNSIRGKRYFIQQKSKSLAEIVESRYNTSKHFPYSQILSLTQTLAYSLAYMTRKKCNHHDFYPTNIYYSQGKFKLINSLQLSSSGFYLTSQRQRFSFLSPQLIIAILQQTSQSTLGEQIMNKSDIFAVGMILLQICSLQPSSQCYDQQSYNIIDEGNLFVGGLEKVKKVYTPVMAECISGMLEYEVGGRVDPIMLAQLVHWKVEGEKMIAMQMEMPKQQQQASSLQQGPPGLLNKRLIHQPPPPQTIPPQHLRNPPPPAPYMHQPFMLQNLNPNIIAVSLPNQQYARIGPNNQGFLSSSSLQQKLRVIELIKEHETEDDQQGEHDCQKKEMVNEVLEEKNQQKQTFNDEAKKSLAEKEQPLKPQYPFVESIYSQKPLIANLQVQNKPQPQLLRHTLVQNRQQISIINQAGLNQHKIPLVRQPTNHASSSINSYQQQVHESNKRTVQTFVRQEFRAPLVQQGNGEKNVQILRTQEIKPKSPVLQYSNQPQKQTTFISYQGQQNYAKLDLQLNIPKQSFQKVNQKASQKLHSKIQPKTQFVTSHNNYNPSPSSKNLPTINNIYMTNYPPKTQSLSTQQVQRQPISNEVYYASKKYGTSYEIASSSGNENASSESIDQRVQRVLNMSRNAK